MIIRPVAIKAKSQNKHNDIGSSESLTLFHVSPTNGKPIRNLYGI